MGGQPVCRTFASRGPDRLEVTDGGTRAHLELVGYPPVAGSGDLVSVGFGAETLPTEQALAACCLLRWALDQESLLVPVLVPIGATLGSEPPRVVLHAKVHRGEMRVCAEKDIGGGEYCSGPFNRPQADAVVECLLGLASK
jgi:hypothetical protein